MRISHARSFGVTESRHFRWHDLCMSRAPALAWLNWRDTMGAIMEAQSCHVHQHDSFISHARQTDVIQKSRIWNFFFGRIYFSKILLKKVKIGINISPKYTLLHLTNTTGPRHRNCLI
jgi:hypothetical protein